MLFGIITSFSAGKGVNDLYKVDKMEAEVKRVYDALELERFLWSANSPQEPIFPGRIGVYTPFLISLSIKCK